MVLKVIDLEIELLVGVGVAAAVGVDGIGADGQAVVADGGEIRDGIALVFVVDRTVQEPLTAEKADQHCVRHFGFLIRQSRSVVVPLAGIVVVEQPVFDDRLGFRLGSEFARLRLCHLDTLRAVDHVADNAVVGIGIDILADLIAVHIDTFALDVIDDGVAAFHIADHGGIRVVVVPDPVVGDTGDLGICAYAVDRIVLRFNLVVFIKFHKGGINVHAVKILHGLLVRADVRNSVVGSGNPGHQQSAVFCLGDGGLEISGFVRRNGNGCAPETGICVVDGEL